LNLTARGRSLDELTVAVANAHEVVERLLSMSAMRCSPLEFNGAALRDCINADTVATESWSNWLCGCGDTEHI